MIFKVFQLSCQTDSQKTKLSCQTRIQQNCPVRRMSFWADSGVIISDEVIKDETVTKTKYFRTGIFTKTTVRK